MSRPLRHPPAATAGTEAATLEGKRHEAVEGAALATEPSEAVGQDAAGQELAELPLDELRQAVAPVPRRGFVEEIVEMVADYGIEHAVLGVTRPIRGMGEWHAREYRERGAAPMTKDGYTKSGMAVTRKTRGKDSRAGQAMTENGLSYLRSRDHEKA